jgi:predicted MFS family arabinose efflux permease
MPTRAWSVRRRYAVGLLLAVFTVNFMDRQILGVLMPPIKAEFGVSDTLLGLLAGPAFTLFYSTLGIPLAVLADRGSRRRLITTCLGLFSLMTALSGFATSFGQLLAARIGVGVGEAGTSPASHSLIADLYGPRERHTAMAVFALGPQLGLLLAFLLGGWVSQRWGWRAAFLVAGGTGLVLAAGVGASLHEPVRDRAGSGLDSRVPGSPVATAWAMWACPALRHILVGASLAVAVGQAVLAWAPSFLVRSHGLGSAAAGALLALVLGAGGAMGTYLGGWLADRLSARDPRWPVWVVALALAVAAPFWGAAYLAPGTGRMLALIVLPGLLVGVFIGPTFALVQSLVEPHRRAVAAAILLFVTNLVGSGLGPLAVGALSDALAPRLGADSLRYALTAASALGAWAALHYATAGRTLAEDLRRTESADG